MSADRALLNLRASWSVALERDEDFKAAWKNVTNMMFKGNISALVGASKLIAQMDWWDGLTEWIEFNQQGQPIVIKSIHLEERPLYAFVIMHCRHLSLHKNVPSWIHRMDEQLDWGMLSIQAASVPTLGEIPDWLIEPLMMGCLHEIEIEAPDSSTLYMHAFPMTQALFEAITEDNPSMCLGHMHPVDSISWFDAVQFCNLLSEAMGYDPVYTISDSQITIANAANGYRLPTTEQWEASAQFKDQTYKYAGHNELWMVGVYDSNTSDHVGRNLPTARGTYDMSGNVWEWCWSDDALYAPRKGGSWMSKEKACAISYTSRRLKNFVNSTQGLRLCRVEFPAGNTQIDSTDKTDGKTDGWDW